MATETAYDRMDLAIKGDPREQFTLRTGGEAFRCSCGGNVFHKPNALTIPNVYECNGCRAWYEGTP